MFIRIKIVILMLLAAISVSAEDHTPDYYDYNVRDHFKHQRWDAGKKLLDEGMRSYGTLSVMCELQGWYFYHYKKYTQARYYLIKSLRDDKANQHSRELLVNVEEETRNFSSAICYINEILETNPYDRGWWRRKINIFRKMGNQQEADRLLVRLHQIYPNDVQIKKDIDYQMELNLATYKKRGDIDGQIKALRQLLRSYPKNVDYYLQLSNLLLQQGKTAEATEVAAQGVRNTLSQQLVRKRAGILAEQGRYSEALAYIDECRSTLHIPGLDQLSHDLQGEAARAALNNDAYVMYGKLYDRTGDADALTYLLNTSLTRGYYDDALVYIAEARKRRGDSFDLTFKEFSVNKRMGNKKAADRLLEKLAQMKPSDEEIREDLVSLHYERANQAMLSGDYADAIPELQYCYSRTTDGEIKKSCARRIYNCYLELKDYDNATQQLETVRDQFDNIRYTLNKVSILRAQKLDNEALALLKEAYRSTSAPEERAAYSDAYEEIVYPKIKGLMEENLMKQAYELVTEALAVCPNSREILARAIAVTDILGKDLEYSRYVGQARTLFPDDPQFILKEAGIYTKQGEYEPARRLIRPLMDVYVGDSTFVKAYVANCELDAEHLRKNSRYEKALEVCNEGLAFRGDNRELLYTKGLVFESLHQYDSAYFYQRKHVPSITEVSEFKTHLELLANKQAQNTLLFEYSHIVNGANDKRTGIAGATYSRKFTKNTYDFSLGYAGRDGMADTANDLDTQEPGGTGIQGGFSWTRRWSQNRATTLGIAAATKYFPLLKLSAAIDFSNVHLTRNFTLNIQPHVNIRWIRTYSKIFRSVKDEGYTPSPDRGEEWNDTLISKFSGWDESKKFLVSGGATLSKDINDQFCVSVGGDLYYMNKHLFYSVNGRGQFFPVEGNPSHVFVYAGMGTAPEASLIDNSLPGTFDHTNTHVGMGGLWFFNRHISLGASGTWYTLYNTNEVLINPAKHYAVPKQLFNTEQQTSFMNYFFLNASLLISF